MPDRQDNLNPVELPISQSSRLIGLLSNLTLWRTRIGVAYVTLEEHDHVRVRSLKFRSHLQRAYWQRFGGAPAGGALDEAIEHAEAKALHEGEEREIAVRVARSEGAIFVDLANGNREVVKVTPQGWEITRDYPVQFSRPQQVHELPNPARGGNIEALKQFVNYDSEDDFWLMVAWLLGCLMPEGPYPILCINGPQGSAKSTTTKHLRTIVDPSGTTLRQPLTNQRDLPAAVSNAWVLAFDNVSAIRPIVADSLCRLATGGSLTGRRLYTDYEEVSIDACRPVALNGIPTPTGRADFLDRSIVLELPAITGSQRRDERSLNQAFGDARPKILGALLDGMVCALRREDEVVLEDPPRLIDWMKFVTGAEPAFGLQGHTFERAYAANRANADFVLLGEQPVVDAIMRFMDSRETWSGTATELLSQLDRATATSGALNRALPRAANALSETLIRLQQPLARLGYQVNRHRSATGRELTIERTSE